MFVVATKISLSCDIIAAVGNLYTSFNGGYAEAGLFNFFFLSCCLSLIPFS